MCGRPFEGSRARFCGNTCRKRSSRGMEPIGNVVVHSRRKSVTQAKISVGHGDNLPDQGSNPVESGLVKATRLKLQNAGIVIEESIEAQQALRIAEQMSGRETAGGMAALSKELSRLTVEALRSAVSLVADPVDELAARRGAKLAG
jgi:hypothetical protein